jgi:hypothetical protein
VARAATFTAKQINNDWGDISFLFMHLLVLDADLPWITTFHHYLLTKVAFHSATCCPSFGSHIRLRKNFQAVAHTFSMGTLMVLMGASGYPRSSILSPRHSLKNTPGVSCFIRVNPRNQRSKKRVYVDIVPIVMNNAG